MDFLEKLGTLICMFFLACVGVILWIAASPGGVAAGHVINWLLNNLISIVFALAFAMLAAVPYLGGAHAGGYLLEACVHCNLSFPRRMATMLFAVACEAVGVLFGSIVYEMVRSMTDTGGNPPDIRLTVCLAIFQLAATIAGWNSGSEETASIQDKNRKAED